jgi:hypothetical protein
MSRLNHHVVGSGMRKNLHDEGNYKKEGNFFCALCAIFFSKRKNCHGLYAEWVPGLRDHPRLICREGAYGTMSLRLFWYRNYNLL